MESVSYSRKIPVKHDVDVFVAGAGPAGVSAAIAASRQGVGVYLAEAHTCSGGMGTAGLVPVFMPFTDGVNFLAGGMGREVLETLQKAGGTFPEDGRTIKAEVLKRVYDELLAASGVRFTYHTRVVDVIVENGVASEGICAGKSGLFAVKAKVFIDGTGDGDLACFAGADYEKGDKNGIMMPGTLCSLWANIAWERVSKSTYDKLERLEQAFKDNVFTVRDWHLTGFSRVGAELGGANMGHTFGVDGTDEKSLTEAYIRGRRLILEFEKFYKNYMEGYENMELAATGSLMGIRSTRRIKGDYVLNIEDFKKCAVFEDEIGRYSYAVDIHPSSPGKESFSEFLKEHKAYRLEKGQSYGIPYRILTPAGLENVLVCGRCVSTDHYVQSSIRVMPGCYITGQSAGIASAIMVKEKKDSRGISITKLQKTLKSAGAFLPNFK